MKIKAADIARELGISKATVSLALNNKPGVNEQTRQMVLECKDKMEHKSKEAICNDSPDMQVIKVLRVSRKLNIIYEAELDLWTDAIEVYDRFSKKMGYSIGLTYVDMLGDYVEQAVNECNMSSVAGVILYATEMQPSDYQIFKRINKPMIIYDNDFEDSEHHRVCIDNVAAGKIATEYLIRKNRTNIQYLANEADIYNFMERREGFRQALLNNDMEFRDDMIIPMGRMIDRVYDKMKKYLETATLPEAYVMENYQVSIGVMQALREKGISVPEDVSLIGVDEIPSYVTGDCKLATVKIAHTDRAVMAMLLLEREMQESIPTKFKIMSNCQLIEGNSVR